MASWVIAGCGLQAVELGVAEDGRGAGVGPVVVGDVDEVVVAQLMAAEPAAEPDARLRWTEPLGELALPANVAPLTFVWRSGDGLPLPPEPGAPPEPGGAAPPEPPMPMAPGMPMGPRGRSTPSAAESDELAIGFVLLVRSESEELLRIYTAEHGVIPPVERWRPLLASQVGHVLEVELRALYMPSGLVVRSAPLQIEVRAATPQGALFAYSIRARGIVSAGLEQPRSSVLASPASESGCVGCHSVSRDGSRILAAVSGEPGVRQSELPGRELTALSVDAGGAAVDYVFGSYDPTGARVALSLAGALYIVDANSGETLDVKRWPGSLVTQPDWSPLGDVIAVSLSADEPGKKAASSDIARVKVQRDGRLGEPELIASDAAPRDVQRLFPSYSPDGGWIAFEQRMGKGRDEQNGSLRLLASDGGESLVLARVAAAPELADGWPSWMPGANADQPWLLFNSSRAAYGGMLEPGRRQLYASAIDLPLAAAGRDPSLGAFHLPFQDPAGSYRHVAWAPSENSCVSQREQCDERDDDCDTRIDEDCCSPQPERCDEAGDEDCDGSYDEGCSCLLRDVCMDDTDDDCDGKIDEQPCSAAPKAMP
ncbi:MAG: hypothetical protein ABW321_09215 [Polyangiales bacterium]